MRSSSLKDTAEVFNFLNLIMTWGGVKPKNLTIYKSTKYQTPVKKKKFLPLSSLRVRGDKVNNQKQAAFSVREW